MINEKYFVDVEPFDQKSKKSYEKIWVFQKTWAKSVIGDDGLVIQVQCTHFVAW